MAQAQSYTRAPQSPVTAHYRVGVSTQVTLRGAKKEKKRLTGFQL